MNVLPKECPSHTWSRHEIMKYGATGQIGLPNGIGFYQLYGCSMSPQANKPKMDTTKCKLKNDNKTVPINNKNNKNFRRTI